MKRWVWLLALSALASAAMLARADTRSVSYSTWIVSGNGVTLRLLLPANEARRLTGTSIPVLTVSKLGDYLLRHVSVQAAGRECPAIDQGYDLGRVDPLSVGRDFYGFEIMFRCDSATDRVLRDAVLFEVVPDHVDFARLELDGRFTQQLFTAGHERLRLPDAGTASAAAATRYLALGARHVLFSLDRWGVLLALLLLAARRRELLLCAAGLGVGYGLVIAESMLGWLVPRVVQLDALVGLAVALLAVGSVALGRDRRIASVSGAGLLLLLALITFFVRGASSALLLCGAAALVAGFLLQLEWYARRDTFWLACGAVIGVIDGFVLPSQLEPLRLSARAMLPMLSGYALGALLIEAAVLASIGGVLYYLKFRLVREQSGWVSDVAAAGLAGLGAFWLLSRLYA